MKLYDGIFAIKLYELEQQFGRLQARIQVCQKMDLQQLRSELEHMTNESKENELLLHKQLAAGRLPAMEALSEAQLTYCRKADEILQKQLIPELSSEDQSISESKAEAAALYAEYAIDHAIQTVRYATIASFSAIEAQLRAEKDQTDGRDTTPNV